MHRFLAQALVWLLAGCAQTPPQPSAEDDAGKLMLAGIHLYQQREHERAIGFFETAATLLPDAADPWYRRCEALLRVERFDEAVASCDEALRRDSRHERAHNRRWVAVLLRDGNTANARAQVREEIDSMAHSEGADVEALYTAWQGYELLRAREAQLSLLEPLMTQGVGSPRHAGVAAAVYGAMRQARDLDEAMRLAGLYLRHFSDRPDTREAARVMFIGLRRKSASVDAALAQLDTLATADNGAWIAWLKGRLLAESPGRGRDAIGFLTQAHTGFVAQGRQPVSDLRPAMASKAAYWLGRVLYKAGDPDAALARFNEAASATHPFPRAWRALAELQAQRGDDEAALVSLRRFLRWRGLPTKADLDFLETLSSRDGLAAAEDVPRFLDVTASAGLKGLKSSRFAIADFDGDGLDDLLLDGPLLLRHRPGGVFRDVTADAGLPVNAGTHGGLWADVDRDGDVDLLLLSKKGNRLYENRDGRFHDISSMEFSKPRASRVEGAAWGDFDRDGLPDLYLAFYERTSVERALCDHDELWHNRGDGRFVEVSRETGVIAEEGMCGRGVVWTDINGDGWTDIVVANYRLDPDFIWVNQGDGSFREEAGRIGARGNGEFGLFGHSIGPVSGDLDQDGDSDLVITGLAHPDSLAWSDVTKVLINPGNEEEWTDTYAVSGIDYEETASDPALGDVDNDGDLDLFFSAVYRGHSSRLYLNDGQGSFRDVTWLAGAGVENGWGTGFWDYDADGDADLLVAGADGVRLLGNQGVPGHWIAVRVASDACERNGIGARLTLLQEGGRRQVRELQAGKGSGTQLPPVARFGLGDNTAPVTLSVTDGCGVTRTISGLHPDRFRTIRRENQGCPTCGADLPLGVIP